MDACGVGPLGEDHLDIGPAGVVIALCGCGQRLDALQRALDGRSPAGWDGQQRAQQFAALGGDRHTAVLCDIHYVDAVRIAALAERHGQGAARIADELVAPYALSLVDMPQGYIRKAGGKLGGVDILLAAHYDALAVLLGVDLAARGVEVGRHDHALVLAVAVARLADDVAEEAAHAAAETVLHGQVGAAQKGHSDAYHLVVGITAAVQRDEQVVEHRAVALLRVQEAAYVYLAALEERTRCLEPHAAVVIAGRHYDLQPGILLRGLAQKVVVELLSRGGGIGIVKDIAGYDKGVGLVVVYRTEQEVQEIPVLGAPVVVVEVIADVPVGSVDNSHS